MTNDAAALEEEIDRRLKAGDTLISAKEIAGYTGLNVQTVLRDWPDRVELTARTIRWWRSDVVKRIAEMKQ